MAVIIETSIGHLTVDLYTDERPRCCKNFLKLCKVKYYNFCLFHSVQPNLVAQTGDPTGTGRGGMSVYGMVYGEQARYFDMEVTPRIKHKKRGQLSMVNNGNGRHGSQFFITLGTDLDYLDGEHTVFGEVAEGFEVLEKLNEAYCDDKHRPYRDIRIFHTVILDDPFDDPEGLVVPDKSPEPTKEMLESDRIGVDEEVDDTKGMTEEEVQEMQAEKEAKANAQLLEMVGDIPDADVKPPDNVLFVCKLNPVTTEEDLEMIFSRFGPIVSCEVIKDHKTKESLQYAFVEFEKPEHCESAYFKMDNVLIDDRRIHVDFSQSVSKIRPSAAGKKQEEEKKEDQPRYVLKEQQRQDNNYDLVFEHDLPEAGPGTRKSKKHRHRRRSDSDTEDVNAREKKKTGQGPDSRSGSRSRSPQGGGEKDRATDRDSADARHVPRPGRDRGRRSSSSPEDERERKTSEEGHSREKKRGRRSPSVEEKTKKEKRRKARSPSTEEDRRKRKKRKERSLSSDEDRQRKRKKRDRSPSPEKERRKDRKKKERSPSPEKDRRKHKKKDRSPSPEKERSKHRKKDRSPSPEKERSKPRKKDRSPSPEKERRKERRRSSTSEEREKRKKEERRGRDSSSSHRRDRR